jgi:uncharacterized membrane protein YphA (DoxX/SURF4 family)
MIPRILSTHAPGAAILVRLAVGLIFFSEGTQKFLFPATVGAGRFAKIGLPAPELLAPLVGGLEIVCGILVVLGLFTRVAAVPLIAVMLVAIASTKLPILAKGGWWAMAHESRTDFAMLLGSLFLLLAGAGPWSLDARLEARRRDR